MSDPVNREILDVLSSIRRLVSEDRKAAAPTPLPAARETAPEQPSALPRESRFVLTAALRVTEPADDADDRREAAMAADEAWARDAEADAAAGPQARPEFTHGDRPDREPATPGSTTLESTIAELEAAVAGIGAEFEPDGSEETGAESPPVPSGLWAEDPVPPRQTQGRTGIMADFDPMAQADERLDAPITGEVMYTEPVAPFVARPRPPQPGSAAESAAPPEEEEAGTDRPEDAERASLARGQPSFEEHSEDRTVDETVGEAADSRAAGTDEQEAAEIDAAPDPMPPPAVRLHLAGDTAARLRIFRADAVADGPEEPDLTAEPPAAAADGEEEGDLLDPLAGADLDVDRLRDMVAELIRDELRGALGERITRNVRALVRREIARAFEARGDRD
jgi:hypothetical protein